MILIASGAYLQGEFATEVGLLPPSFLPIGNQRLYEYQIQFLRSCCDSNEYVYLSVPASYKIDAYDSKRLAELGVEVLLVPDGLSLGNSLLYCWNATAKHHENLTLLHGDTLFLNACYKASNAVSVHTNRGFYQRASLGREAQALEEVYDGWSNDCEQVVSGFFRFSDPLCFMKSLVEAKSDFIQALVAYHQTYPLALLSKGDWLDLGHINSFYLSRIHMTTQRAFNELKIRLRTVTKSSQDKGKKIYAEGNWFAQLPLPLRLYTPSLLDLEQGAADYVNARYVLEYLYLLPLSDLLVFNRLAKGCWQTIFNAIAQMLVDFGRYKPDFVRAVDLEEIERLYLPKTLSRLDEYANQQGFDLDSLCFSLQDGQATTLVEMAYISLKFIQPVKAEDIAITHGDLCFSNMLFDGRVGAIKCIDPRGITSSGELSLFGDRRYDLAKLYHSVVGLYDFIIAGRFEINEMNQQFTFQVSCDQELHDEVVGSFRSLVLDASDYSEKEILAITIHLFLSMLPLHADRPERQQAFIANALRLFKQLTEINE